MTPLSDAPTDLRDLTCGERMIIMAFRAMVVGRGRCLMLKRRFESLCGPAAAEAQAAFAVFVREAGVKGRRTIVLSPPGCLSLTRDEQLVLALFASAQAGEYARMEAHLAWLLAGTPEPPFAAACCLVAQALAMNGSDLRLFTAEGPEPRQEDAARPFDLVAGAGG